MSSQELIDAVRNWVHFDNLYAMLSRQMLNARNMRNSFEDKILSLLGNTKRLRIQGAILEPCTRKNSVGLNWTVLEESLHKYYKDTKKTDETDEILNFLRENRGSKTTVYLKKTPIVETNLKSITNTE
jgi:hypothetical protein